MTSETIIESVYHKVINFLQRMLGVDKITLLAHLKKAFPTSEDMSKTMSRWLREHSLTNMQTCIHSFAQLFPNYESFAAELDSSLALHDYFWHDIHRDLCIAKSQM